MTKHYANYLYLGRTCFQNKNNVTSINCHNIPWIDNNIYGAFINCHSVTDITGLDQNITQMQGAFRNCYSLVNAPAIPSSITNLSETFSRCNSLTSAPVIPNSVVSLYSTFAHCSNLTTMPTIPNSVTNMSGTFEYCSSLNGTIQIPNSVINMSFTFLDCKNLTTIPTISSNAGTLYGTFYNCKNLTGDFIYTSTKNLTVTKCFNGCEKLNSINIQGVNGSLEGMCTNCYNLQSAYITAYSISSLNNCFQGCNNLKTVHISSTEDNASFPSANYAFHYCKNLVTVDLSLRNLYYASDMFSYCEKLQSFPNIPYRIIDGRYMFDNCISLTTVPEFKPPMNAQYMFRNCKNLTTAYINNTNSSCLRANYMFQGCTSLKDVYFISYISDIGNIFENIGSTTRTNVYCTGAMYQYLEWQGYDNAGTKDNVYLINWTPA